MYTQVYNTFSLQLKFLKVTSQVLVLGLVGIIYVIILVVEGLVFVLVLVGPVFVNITGFM